MFGWKYILHYSSPLYAIFDRTNHTPKIYMWLLIVQHLSSFLFRLLWHSEKMVVRYPFVPVYIGTMYNYVFNHSGWIHTVIDIEWISTRARGRLTCTILQTLRSDYVLFLQDISYCFTFWESIQHPSIPERSNVRKGSYVVFISIICVCM